MKQIHEQRMDISILSFQVQQGILYVDECNFHLNHVVITWPEGYVPRSATSISSANILSSPIPQQAYPPTNSVNTQQALQVLGEYVDLASTSTNSPVTEELLTVPDLAKRQVSVNFEELVLPQTWKAHDIPTPISTSLAVEQDEEEEEEVEEIEEEADSQGEDLLGEFPSTAY